MLLIKMLSAFQKTHNQWDYERCQDINSMHLIILTIQFMLLSFKNNFTCMIIQCGTFLAADLPKGFTLCAATPKS